jgi:hypothetical protein
MPLMGWGSGRTPLLLLLLLLVLLEGGLEVGVVLPDLGGSGVF